MPVCQENKKKKIDSLDQGFLRTSCKGKALGSHLTMFHHTEMSRSRTLMGVDLINYLYLY